MHNHGQSWELEVHLGIALYRLQLINICHRAARLQTTDGNDTNVFLLLGL